MKTAIILLFALAPAFLLCQDFEPSQRTFTYTTDNGIITTFLSSDSSWFKQDKFLLGCHWGPQITMGRRMLMNMRDSDHWTSADDMVDGAMVLLKPKGYSHAVDPTILNGRGIHYDPTLPLSPDNLENPVARPGDHSRNVFGFLYRRGRIPTDSTDVDFHRLIIDSVELNNQVVLAEPWPSNELSCFASDQSPTPDTYSNYLCRTLIFAINLRRYDNQDNSDSLLKVEIPYTVFVPPDSGLARFASIPSSIADSIISLGQRGIIRKTVTAPPSTTAFYIKRNMLPPDGQDITIMARLTFKNSGLSNDNPFLKKSIFNPDSFNVDKIKIRITKMNAPCSLAVKYVRLITPHTDTLMRGYLDDEIYSEIQGDLDRYAAPEYRSRGIRILRFNTIVEGSIYNWITERYFNKLVGNISTNEVEPYYTHLYEHYVNPSDRWINSFELAEFISTPLHRNNFDYNIDNLVKTYGLVNGLKGYPDTDAANVSSYETFIAYNSKNNLLPITRFIYNTDEKNAEYCQAISYGLNGWVASFQVKWENTLYNSYFRPDVRSMIFSDKYWWPQSFILSEWSDTTSQIYGRKKYLHYTRHLTAAEFRLSCWTPLILGAKALLYDGTESDANDTYARFTRLYDNTWLTQEQINSLAALEDWDFIESDMAGPDFIRENNEIGRLSENLCNFDTLAKYTGRPKDKLYIGRRNIRMEMRKLHELIKAEEPAIMSLRLQCWLGKGFMKYYLQHPSYSDCMINNFIDTAGIRTRWPGSDNYEGTAQFNYQDSSFYDITILKDQTNDPSMSNSFYFGLVNRRTSPLILENDTLNFYTDAEFADFIRNGGGYSLAWNEAGTEKIYRTANEWKSLYRLQAGAREITIPFVYKNPIDTSEYCLLRITELGKGTSLDNEWWRQEPYMSAIDTVIGQDRPLSVKFLPGEGKIFKVQVLRPPTNLKGKLEFSNQSKLIAYPEYIGSRKTDSIRYHLVYYRPTDLTNPARTVNMVYYVRSRPVWKDSQDENIVWEQEICVSDTIINGFNPPPDTLFRHMCQYPAIVVRKDGAGNPKAYIIYSCDKDNNRQGYIAETILDVGGATAIDNPGRVLSLFYSDGPVSELYGVPCINASSNGNYYAWSDSTYGIIAGFKSPGSTSLDDTTRIKFGNPFPGINCNKCAQPSMNVYSNIEMGEDNCALVWMESLDSILSMINYTRLRFTNGYLHNYTPKLFGCRNRNRNGVLCFNLDSSIACMQLSSSMCEYPSVCRRLNNYSTFYDPNQSRNFNPNREDVIVWSEVQLNPICHKNPIVLKTVCMHDTSNLPYSWEVSNPKKVISLLYNFSKPSVNYGMGILNFSRTAHGKRESSLKGNFLLDLVYNNTKITQLPFHSRLFTFDYNYLNTYLFYLKIIGEKSNPHLSNLPFFNENIENLWINRQAFEHGDNTIPDIWASASGFYRKAEDEYLEAEPMVGFRINNDSMIANYMISLPRINDDYTKIFLPYDEIVDTVYGNQYIQKETDTLLTDWFIVGAYAEVTFKAMGRMAPNFTMYIEKQNDTALTEVMLPESPYDSAATFRVILLNGLDDNYRLVFINRNFFPAYYTEELYIGGIPISDTFLSRNSSFERIVNLNPGYNTAGENSLYIIARPNPANDKIEVRIIPPEKTEPKGSQPPSKFRIVLYDLTGEILYSNELSSGKTALINTESYQPGSYFLRAEEIQAQWGAETAKPAVEKIIIAR